MNTLSGRGPFSTVTAFDTSLSGRNILPDTERAAAVDSVPVSCCVLTPTRAAPPVSVSGMQSPNVFTGYPVLTLPSPGGSPRHRSSPPRSPRSMSPRNSRSPASPYRSRLPANKAALEGQPCIEQFFQSAVSCQSAAVPHSSSLPQSSSSEMQTSSLSLDRKQTQPDKAPVSPLLSRKREEYVKLSAAKDLQSSDISAAGFSRSDKNCTSSDMQRERCSFDTVTPVKTNLIEQPVSVDIMPENANLKTTQLDAAEVQLKSLKVSSNDAASTDEKTANIQSPLKISMPKLQKMRQIWEKNCSSMYEKAAKSGTCGDMNSEASILLPSSVVSTEVMNVITNSNVSSASSCATSSSTSAEVSTRVTVASRQSSSAIEFEGSDAVACEHMDTCLVNDQQNVPSVKAVPQPAVNMDISNGASNETHNSAADAEMIDTAMHELTDSSHTDQQILLDHDVNYQYDRVDTVSVSTAQVIAPNEVKPSTDIEMDVDCDSLEDFAPVESKPFFFFLLFHS